MKDDVIERGQWWRDRWTPKYPAVANSTAFVNDGFYDEEAAIEAMAVRVRITRLFSGDLDWF